MPPMGHVTLRISKECEVLAQGLAQVRQEKAAQIERTALELGLRILAVTHPDLFEPERLAALLRPTALLLNDFLAQQGHPLAPLAGGGGIPEGSSGFFPVDATVYNPADADRMPLLAPAYNAQVIETLGSQPDLL